MSDEHGKSKAGTIFNIVESVILAVSVGLIAWTAQVVIEHGNTLSSHGTLINVNSDRVSVLENKGSRNLETHVHEDDQRINDLKDRVSKLEAAILTMAAMPGDIKALSVKLESLREGQGRLEKMMEKGFRP